MAQVQGWGAAVLHLGALQFVKEHSLSNGQLCIYKTSAIGLEKNLPTQGEVQGVPLATFDSTGAG